MCVCIYIYIHTHVYICMPLSNKIPRLYEQGFKRFYLLCILLNSIPFLVHSYSLIYKVTLNQKRDPKWLKN